MRLRFSFVAVFALLSQVLSGQYYHLATPADGSVVYFDTDYPRTGTTDARQGRIYTVDASGLQVFAERQREEFPGNPVYTNYYQLSSPAVSGDGTTRAFRGVRRCIGRACGGPAPLDEVTMQRPGLPDLHAVGGDVQLSSNGRYALLSASHGLTWAGGLIDLGTGVVQPFSFHPLRPFTPGRQIADDGTVVSAEFARLTVDRGAERQITELYPWEFPEQAVIDAAARFVVYSSRWSFPYASNIRIRALDLRTGNRWTVVEDFADFHQPVLSDDGQQLLFLTNCLFDESGFVGPPQAYLIGMDGTGMRPLTSDPAGIREAVLSGNGKVVFAVTLAGRLLRIDVESGETVELLPRTLAVTMGYTGNVAGSVMRFSGVGYLGADGNPEPVTVHMGDRIAPVAWWEPGELAVQVPWELAGVPTKLTLTTDVPPTPFVPPAVEFEWIPQSFGPQMQPLPDEYGKPGPDGLPYGLVLHADSSVVGVEVPAHPGETVRAVVTGLGPVDPVVPTGEPAPVDGPPSVVRAALSCFTWTDNVQFPIPVVSATLARGEIGVYHLDLALPSDLPQTSSNNWGSLQIACTGDLIVNLPFVFPRDQAAKVAQ